jgi:hypothetical protein
VLAVNLNVDIQNKKRKIKKVCLSAHLILLFGILPFGSFLATPRIKPRSIWADYPAPAGAVKASTAAKSAVTIIATTPASAASPTAPAATETAATETAAAETTATETTAATTGLR